jgi:dTDP-4-dehydrorhamnose reductase
VRILITGASGLLGGRLCLLLGQAHSITALVRERPGPEGVTQVSTDLTEADAVERILDEVRPDAVIHCAALADAEVCEREPERARRDNEIASRKLARACRRAGARLVAISTDLVLAGDRPLSSEASPAAPLMEYGRSKLRGEGAITEECRDAVILRVALICGQGYGARLSGSEAVAARLRRGESATLYEDEWRTPIDPESVCTAIEAILARPQAQGLFHLGGLTRLTRLELGQRVASALNLDAGLIRAAPQSSHQGAPRPRDVSLDITRAREELGWTPRPLDAALAEGRTG